MTFCLDLTVLSKNEVVYKCTQYKDTMPNCVKLHPTTALPILSTKYNAAYCSNTYIIKLQHSPVVLKLYTSSTLYSK